MSDYATRVYAFAGGVHPPHAKASSEALPIETAPAPETVVIPLSQHIGAPCKPIVKVNDKVKVGQCIAEAGGFVSAPIHASVSGKVKKIEPRPHPSGGLVDAIVIENDGEDSPADFKVPDEYFRLEAKDVIQLIADAGIVGLGGACFPTHVKLSLPKGTNCKYLILNGAECEPYLTADHRIMLESPDEIFYAIKALGHILSPDHTYIGVEDNKMDAIELLTTKARSATKVSVSPLKVKYPQGAELQLIKACVDREVPRGKLPIHAECLVQNVGTMVAITHALREGRPLYERVVTVTGNAVAQPKNLLVRVGTPFEKVIEACGGFCLDPGKVIAGGPMMGIAQKSLEVPVVKGTSGILCLSRDRVDVGAYSPCIRCARCVDGCPQGIVPTTAAMYAEAQMAEEAENFAVLDCKECGCCSFICPSKRPLVQWMKLGKNLVWALRKKREDEKKKADAEKEKE